ncbi:MAG: substrate-binding domain-containing protein [Frankiales bacterium]|nr:substrate-binding domain-containing protein [Frankiales bacterium]
MTLHQLRTTTLAGAGLTAAALLLAACGGGTTSTAAVDSAPVAPAASGAAAAASSVDYAGTLREPASTARPAATGKKVVIISAGQASISSSVPVAAAKEAAEAAGWKADVYDVQLNPANAPGLVRQAIASGADGIILQAVDCPGVKGPLQEAKAKGIQVVGIYSFDCNDPLFKGNDPALFSGQINYGAGSEDIGAFTKKYGADQAKAVIAATGGKAKVIFFNSPSVTVLSYTGQGFKDELAKCSGCKIVADVEFAGSELGPNLQQKATSALLQHPEANVVKSPYTSATLLGIAPAVVQSGRASKLYLMGGEGFAPELDLLRAGQGVNAVNIAPSDWTGWAAVDTMNSLFTGKPVADSGLGWQLVDKDHNLTASGPFVPAVDFKAIYKKAWGA